MPYLILYGYNTVIAPDPNEAHIISLQLNIIMIMIIAQRIHPEKGLKQIASMGVQIQISARSMVQLVWRGNLSYHPKLTSR